MQRELNAFVIGATIANAIALIILIIVVSRTSVEYPIYSADPPGPAIAGYSVATTLVARQPETSSPIDRNSHKSDREPLHQKPRPIQSHCQRKQIQGLKGTVQ